MAHYIDQEPNLIGEPVRLRVSIRQRHNVREIRTVTLVHRNGRWHGCATDSFPLDTPAGRRRLAALPAPLDTLPEEI